MRGTGSWFLNLAQNSLTSYILDMSVITVSMPDALAAQVETRSKATGFRSTAEYMLALALADCDHTAVESVLEERAAGPFSVLESDWKDRVRDAVTNRAE